MARYYTYNPPYTAEEKLEALSFWKKNSIKEACSKYGCTESTLRRWHRQYDGTLESLKNRSPIPHSPHPKEMPSWEKEKIKNIVMKNPGISDKKLAQILGTNRNPATLYRKREKIFGKREILKKSDFSIIFSKEKVDLINYNDFLDKIIPENFFTIEVVEGLFLRENSANYPVCLTPYFSVALKFKTENEAINTLKGFQIERMRWIPTVKKVMNGKIVD